MTTAAQRAHEARARQMIHDGIAALPLDTAIGALQQAILLHPDITPQMAHAAGNTLSQAADDMERDNRVKTGDGLG